MHRVAAVIFDLGETLVDWPDWDTAAETRWGEAYDFLCLEHEKPKRSGRHGGTQGVGRVNFIRAMRRAELAHWRRVEQEMRSGSAQSVISEGFRRLRVWPSESDALGVLDGYARAVSGWAQVYPDSRPTLEWIRARGLRIGLLSNTWWAAAWHNADLAAHGLQDLLDAVVYTSDLPRSKPHPSVFRHVAHLLDVAPDECVMVGDRPIDDIGGALSAGMQAVFKTNGHPRPVPAGVQPSATIETLSELPAVLGLWQGSGPLH